MYLGLGLGLGGGLGVGLGLGLGLGSGCIPELPEQQADLTMVDVAAAVPVEHAEGAVPG